MMNLAPIHYPVETVLKYFMLLILKVSFEYKVLLSFINYILYALSTGTIISPKKLSIFTVFCEAPFFSISIST